MANGLLILTILLFSVSAKAEPLTPPMRTPGMEIGRPPEESLEDLKFTYDSKNKLFKDEAEAKEFQKLFTENKDSKEIKDQFAKVQEDRKKKMDEMRKNGTRPDFEKMKEEREVAQFDLLKAIKNILENKKKEKSTVAKADVKCEGAKSQPILEKVTTDSMKDSAKVTKIILTEEEYKRMKSELRNELKNELKEELKKEMTQGRPNEEMRDRPSRDKDKEEDRPKMAEGKSKGRQGRGEGMGMNMNMGGSSSNVSQMASAIGQQMMNNFQNMGQSSGMQMGNMNQMQMGSMNQMQMGGMNQRQMGNMNQMPQGMYGMQTGNQMPRMPRQQQGMMNNQMNVYGNQMNMGGYGNDRLQMNPFPSNTTGYNFMASDMNSSYTYGNSMMNPYSGNSYYATYGSQIGIPYMGTSSFAQMGN
ncbi:hypothetical protein DOM21_10500 [Bacteriovorax stolpii]|uniref:hypothetical protein n=1 Tax=Bacteriovorax stolpii TaxID=960 RepID=UPI001159C17E|nr:hypothetical protein [Bacteriovorax stolpii]QDK41868.1 hypothetical protein DOM21_10500 [Bacteriovorax stolpii]